MGVYMYGCVFVCVYMLYVCCVCVCVGKGGEAGEEGFLENGRVFHFFGGGRCGA